MSPDWLSPEETARAVDYLVETFGMPSAILMGHRLLRRGAAVLALRSEAEGACVAYRWVAAGLKVLRQTGSGDFRLTTAGAQTLGRQATRRVWDAGAAALRALVAGQSLPWGGERGPVILRWRGSPLGLGVARADQLVGQLPRAVTEYLRFAEGLDPL